MNRTFWEKLILKHFMHRTIPKRCILGVFWTTQYVYEVYFTWWRVLLTRLTSFYDQLLYFGDMFLNGISLDFSKKPRNIHFDLILFFHFPVKLVLSTYGPFSRCASQLQKNCGNISGKNWSNLKSMLLII